jgi:type I restriction enzyme R subunit
MDETRRALDLGLFINGLPIATFELKNSLTKQTVEDAVEQYRRDRDPRERLFEFGRCVVHFAVDDAEVRMCTAPEGQGPRGSCPSTRAGTTAPATRPTRTA